MNKSILSLVIASGFALSATNTAANIVPVNLKNHSKAAVEQKVLSTFKHAQELTAKAKAIGATEGYSHEYFAATREAKLANETAIAARAWYAANYLKPAPVAMSEKLQENEFTIPSGSAPAAPQLAGSYLVAPTKIAPAPQATPPAPQAVPTPIVAPAIQPQATPVINATPTLVNAPSTKPQATPPAPQAVPTPIVAPAIQPQAQPQATPFVQPAVQRFNEAQAHAERGIAKAAANTPAALTATALDIGNAEGYSPEYFDATRKARDANRVVLAPSAPVIQVARTAAPVATSAPVGAAAVAPTPNPATPNSNAVAAIDKRIATQAVTQKVTDDAQDVKIKDNADAIALKADQSNLTALQQRITLDEQYDGDAISLNRQGVADNAAAVSTENQRATAAEATNATNITANKQSITAETSRATAAEATNANNIATNAQGITANKQSITAETSRATAAEATNANNIATNTQGIATNKAEIAKTNTRVSTNEKRLDSHEGRIQTLEANKGYGNKFNALKNQVEQNRKHASAGTSSAMAMANIPQVLQGQTFAVGAGVGGYDGENGIAVGFSARVTESVVVKATVSDDSQQNFGYGAGVSIGW